MPRWRRGDGRVDLLDRGEVDLASDLARRRVVDGSATAGRAGDAPAADPVAERLRPSAAERSAAVRSSSWVMVGNLVVARSGRGDRVVVARGHDTAPGAPAVR